MTSPDYEGLAAALESDRLPECSFDDGKSWETDDVIVAEMFAASARAIRHLVAERDRLRDCLLGIALTDRYRRYPKQHEDGGLRGQSGLRAVRALTGQHGSTLSDADVERLDKEARAALSGRKEP